MANPTPLFPLIADTGEVFNIGEDGSNPKGQLRRFLKILGPVFDEAKGLVDAMPAMRDVDTTDIDFLKHIAALVGAQYDSTVPTAQSRQDIKQQVAWYKQKGTLPGCGVHGFKNTRLQTTAWEFHNNIRTSNRSYCLSADQSNGSTALNMGLPGDKTAYSFDFAKKNVLVIGKEFASSYVAGYQPLKAIDGNESSYWRASAAAPGWWAYHFDTPFLPETINIKANLGLKDFVLQWCSNNTTTPESSAVVGAATITTFDTGLSSVVDDFYLGMKVTFTTGALAGKTGTVMKYTGATKTIRLYAALPGIPSGGDGFTIDPVWVDGQDFRYGDVQEFTENIGLATGLAQTLGVSRAPISEHPTPVSVYMATAYGLGNTTLLADVQPGSMSVTVVNAGGFSLGDFIEIAQGEVEEVHLISRIEGNLFTFTSAVQNSFGAASVARNLMVSLMSAGTDYSVNDLSGFLTLVVGRFVANSKVIVLYEALSSRSTVDVWQSFYVDTNNLVAEPNWRLLVNTTWYGNPEIAEISMYPVAQLFPRHHRDNRIGYFIRLDGVNPFTQAVLTKLQNSLTSAVAAGIIVVVIVLDLQQNEVVSGVTNVLETWNDVIT